MGTGRYRISGRCPAVLSVRLSVDLGTYGIIIYVAVAIAVYVLFRVVQQWRSIWDATYTQPDRLLVSQAAVFLLLPVSVALHELGHAAAIWAFGGRVIDFGFYGFAGYVSYREPFSDAQHTVVAAAGTIVNILLCAGAAWAALVRRRPFRVPINDLLSQFALISGVNALILYPLLDFSSGLNGDFRQIYAFDAPVASSVFAAIHLGALGAGIWAMRSPLVRARWEARTGRPSAGGQRPGRPVELRFAGAPLPFPAGSALAVAGEHLREAAGRIAPGWPVPVQHSVVPVQTSQGAPPSGVALLLRWPGTRDGLRRQVIAQSGGTGDLRLVGQAGEAKPGASAPASRFLASEPLPEDDQLVQRIRVAMEQVDGWEVAGRG